MSQSALRALQILEQLARGGPSSLKALAHQLDLNKSTTYRFLTALIEAGYAQQDPVTRDYAPTTKLVQLAAEILERVDIRSAIRPILEETAKLTSETVHLAILEDHEIVYIDKVEGRQAMQMASRVGRRGNCHSTALGKVLLAFRSPEEWEEYFAERELTARTENTITDPDRFRRELRLVRERGWATDDVENERGIRCVGAAIRDHTGNVIAAMSISGWTESMTSERIHQLTPLIVERAAGASHLLGFSPPQDQSSEDVATPVEPAVATR